MDHICDFLSFFLFPRLKKDSPKNPVNDEIKAVTVFYSLAYLEEGAPLLCNLESQNTKQKSEN